MELVYRVGVPTGADGFTNEPLNKLTTLLRAKPSKEGDAELRGYRGKPPCLPGRQRDSMINHRAAGCSALRFWYT
jgi:hypothetical protein